MIPVWFLDANSRREFRTRWPAIPRQGDYVDIRMSDDERHGCGVYKVLRVKWISLPHNREFEEVKIIVEKQ